VELSYPGSKIEFEGNKIKKASRRGFNKADQLNLLLFKATQIFILPPN
jgi:hypothetical protein